MVIRADRNHASRRATTPWSALKGEKLLSLLPTVPLQQLVDKHLARAGVAPQPGLLHGLPALIAMVEAGEGAAIIPSFGLPACRERRVIMSRLINPVVHVDFQQIRRAGSRLPTVAEEFTSFLQRYIASWAGRSGVL
jgi:DNA-binding transcriptional LysR family regulator